MTPLGDTLTLRERAAYDEQVTQVPKAQQLIILEQRSFSAAVNAKAALAALCGRIGYTGPTGRTGPCPDPSDPTAYCTHTSLAQLLASSSLLAEVYPSF